MNKITLALVVSVLTLAVSLGASHTVTKEDIRENATRIELNAGQNTERYKRIEAQNIRIEQKLDTLVEKLN